VDKVILTLHLTNATLKTTLNELVSHKLDHFSFTHNYNNNFISYFKIHLTNTSQAKKGFHIEVSQQ